MQDQSKKPQAPQTGWIALVIFIVFLVWGYYYLFTLRPIMNNWLAHYIGGYPAILHLVPVLAVPALAAIVLAKIFGLESSNGRSGNTSEG